MNCRKCLKEIPEISVYCLYCGTKQTASYHRRANGIGSVYKAPSGSWIAEITTGYEIIDGKAKRKKRRKAGFATKKDAVLYLDQLRQGSEKLPTFSALWERYASRELLEISKGKQGAYTIAFNKIAPFIGDREISSVSTAELQDIVEEIAPTYYTRKDVKVVLSHLYVIAIYDDLIDRNRAEFIKMPPKDATERETLTDEEINSIWIDYKQKKSRISAALLIMLYTGMRPVELRQLSADNCDLKQQFAMCGAKSEKGKNRRIILPDKIIPVIREYLSSPYSSNNKKHFYTQYEQKRAELGIRDGVSPYCCRHTYITRLTALGVSPAMLKELAGHEDYETTLSYTHLSVSDRLKEVNRL